MILISYGGSPSELEVSRATAHFYHDLLGSDRSELLNLGVTEGAALRIVREQVLRRAPHVVINATHGGYGEGGPLQELLEHLQVRYTNSGPLASRRCMDKTLAGDILRSRKISTSNGFTWQWNMRPRDWASPGDMVLKPNGGGSSEGIVMLKRGDSLPSVDTYEWNEVVRVEDYVDGPEVTVACLEGLAFTPVEIELPHGQLNTQHLKYRGSRSIHCPPRLDASVVHAIQNTAVMAGRALGCRGTYRVDMRLRDGVTPVVLEVNTQPGMRKGNLFTLSAQGFYDASQLVEIIVNNAGTRRDERL